MDRIPLVGYGKIQKRIAATSFSVVRQLYRRIDQGLVSRNFRKIYRKFEFMYILSSNLRIS